MYVSREWGLGEREGNEREGNERELGSY